MSAESFDDLLQDVFANRYARVAYKENAARQRLAVEFEETRKAKGISVRTLAREMGTSLSQVQRLLHIEAGASLTLRTVFRGADVLGLNVLFHVMPSGSATPKLTGVWRQGPRPMPPTMASSPALLEAARIDRPWDTNTGTPPATLRVCVGGGPS